MEEELDKYIETLILDGASDEDIDALVADFKATYKPKTVDKRDQGFEGIRGAANFFEDRVVGGLGKVSEGFWGLIGSAAKGAGIVERKLQSGVLSLDSDYRNLPDQQKEQVLDVYGKTVGSGAMELGDKIKDLTAVPEQFTDTMGDTEQAVYSGIGQGIGMIATAGAGGASQAIQQAPKTASFWEAARQSAGQLADRAISVPGVLGGSASGVPEWEAAKASGLSDDEAFDVLVKNYFVGQTEALPIANMLGRLNKVTGGKLTEMIKTSGMGAFEEGLQETFQTYLTNEIAKDSYDPDRDPFFQVLESGQVGAIVGAILPSIGRVALNLPAEQKVKLERKAAEIQASKAINDITDSGDPEMNAIIDAAAEVTPEIKAKSDELKAEAVVEEQVKEAEDVLKDSDKQQKEEIKKATDELPEVEEGQEPPITFDESPAFKAADEKVKTVADQIRNADVQTDIKALQSQLNEAIQERDNARIEFEQKPSKKPRQEKSVKMTPAEALKHQVQTFYRGMDEGVRKGQKMTNEQLVSKVQEAVKNYDLTPRQVNALLSKVKKTNLFTPGSISKLNTFIDNVTSDAEYADKIAEANAINKRLRKLAKSKEGLQNYKSIARAFASINPEDSFINPHLKLGREILAGLTSPSSKGYSAFNVEQAESYIDDLQSKIEEGVEEEVAKEPDGEKRNLQIFTALKSSIDALQTKDLSDFDDSEVAVINSLKGLKPETLSDAQAATAVRVIDNIVENDDLSNTGAIRAIIDSKKGLEELTADYGNTKTKDIKGVGKVAATIYQQFGRIFGNSSIAAEVQRKTGISDLINAGSKVETQEIRLTKELKDKIKQVNKKYRIKVQDLPNQIRLVIFSELYKNYGDNSHIKKILGKGGNLDKTISEYQKTEPKDAAVWQKVKDEFKDVNSPEEALDVIKKHPGLFDIWKFFNSKFTSDINPKLERITTDLHNKPYLEANNYSHTGLSKLSDTVDDKEAFGQSTQRSGKVKPIQAKTSLKANRQVPKGYGYSSDWISSQLRGYRESLYDIEASNPSALVRESIYSPEFESLIGGANNAEVVRKMIKRSEEIQRGMSRSTANDAVKFLNEATKFIRTLGSVRALGSVAQPAKQVPSVWVKSFINHIGTNSIGDFFRGIGAVNLMGPDSGLRKLFDQYSIGVRGERLGGIERGDSISFRLAPGSKQGLARAAEYLHQKSDQFSKIALTPLTNSDTYAARTTWLGYYLQSLREQGVSDVDLPTEYLKQEDPKRKQAAAYAEQVVAETQVPSNPATLSQLSRNENDGGWNLAKNILLPFSTFSINSKYRQIQDVDKFIRQPNAQNAALVVGDVFEIAAYAGVAYALAEYYKPILRTAIEGMFDLDEPERDEEKAEASKLRTLRTNLLNASVPLSVGTLGESGVSYLANRLAKLADDPDMTYEEWKKETGGFVWEPDKFDMGVFALGMEAPSEAAKGIYESTGAVVNDNPVTLTEFGRSQEIQLTEQQKRLLVVKTIMDLANTVGFNEADLYREIQKVYKEQLREESKYQ